MKRSKIEYCKLGLVWVGSLCVVVVVVWYCSLSLFCFVFIHSLIIPNTITIDGGTEIWNDDVRRSGDVVCGYRYNKSCYGEYRALLLKLLAQLQYYRVCLTSKYYRVRIIRNMLDRDQCYCHENHPCTTGTSTKHTGMVVGVIFSDPQHDLSTGTTCLNRFN